MIATIHDLVSFLREFHRPWGPNPGLPASEIPGDLPDGLALLYREFGRLIEIDEIQGPFGTQDGLVPLSRLERIEGMFEFVWENQSNWSCRCPVGRGDPAVYSNAGDGWRPGREPGFLKVCDSLNHFLITFCLQEAVMSAANLVAFRTESVADVLKEVPAPIWLQGYYAHGEPSHDFYLIGQDVLLMNYAGLWMGSNSPTMFESIKAGVDFNTLSHS
jgi:hypothetical protein